MINFKRVGLEFDSCVSWYATENNMMITCQDNSNNQITEFEIDHNRFENMSTFEFICMVVLELEQVGYECRDQELYEIGA